MVTPGLIALCGLPGSGKSEIQKILDKKFGYIPFDDGHILRQHCCELFDMSLEDVTTQEGKAGFVEIQGETWQRRKVVGEYGNALEQLFGDLTVPNWAIRSALRDWPSRRLQSDRPLKGYSFGSVRRSQGRAYRAAGGLVIEIARPGVAPTGNVWDEYDKGLVTHSYLNDTLTLEGLERDFTAFFEGVLAAHGDERKAA